MSKYIYISELLNSEDELLHYGVKGMKWGVRRYQDKYGRLTAAGKRQIKDRQVNSKIEAYVKSGKAYVENLESYTVEGARTVINSGRKYLSALVAPIDFDHREVLSVDGDMDDLDSPALAIKEAVTRGFDLWSVNDDDAAAHRDGRLSDNDLAVINEGYGASGTKNNCGMTVLAAQMRMRGFDISAGRNLNGQDTEWPEFWFKDARRVDYGADFAEEGLRSYGPNTSGSIDIRYPGGGGHVMSWTNDSNGNFEIQDTQANRRFDSVDSMVSAYGADVSKNLCTYRLDNLEPNYDNIASDGALRVRDDTLGYEDEDYTKIQNRFTGRLYENW